MNSILIWLVSAVLGLSSVTTQSTAVTEEKVPAPASIERRFAEREMLPPCGMVDVSPHAPGEPTTRLSPPRRAWRCLHDAMGVGGAELVALEQRRDGSARQTFYRATPDGRMEIWTQRTRSAARRGSLWTYQECTPAQEALRQPCGS